MKFNVLSAAATLALAPVVLAQDAPKPVTDIRLTCKATITWTNYHTVLTSVTRRPTSIVTPTVTKTVYKGQDVVFQTQLKTVATVTKQVATTTTVPTTVFNTVSLTKTITAPAVLTTLPPSTTVVPTSDGFTMVGSALANVPAPSSASNATEDFKRAHARDLGIDKRGALHCTQTILSAFTVYETSTVFAGKTVVQTAAPTTTTTNVKKTVTVPVVVATTDTHTHTNTMTHFNTISKVTTTTVMTTTTPHSTITPSPIATYLACASDNLLDYTYGQYSNSTGYTHVGISTFTKSDDDSLEVVAGVKSASECCAACQKSPLCAGSAYGADGTCSLVMATTCSANQGDTSSFQASSSQNLAVGAGYILSNGNCGQWSYEAES